MFAQWDLAQRLRCRIVLRLAVGCAGLLVLGAAGCNGNRERVIDVLPPPTAVHRPEAPRYKPRPVPPKRQTAAVPWWRWNTRPTPPPRVNTMVAPEAGWVPSKGIGRQWECIVVHHSANDRDTPKSMDAWHRKRGWDCLGYDFVIGNGVGYPDGEIFVGPRWTRQMAGAHCKTPGAYYNEHGIGICLIGNMDDHRPSERQMQSLSRLVRFLQAQCDIPQSKILTHGGVTHRTECPGRYFSISDLLRRLNTGW